MTMTYAILKTNPSSYRDIRRRLDALPRADYGHMIAKGQYGSPERLILHEIALEADDKPAEGGGSRRAALAELIERIATEGSASLREDRALDAALDAIFCLLDVDPET